MDTSSAPWETATAELELEMALQVLRKAEGKVKRKEDSLGVTAKQQLRHLIKSPFLMKKMNAQRLRSRKFELDRLERSYWKQRSEKRINEHTQDSVKRRDPGIAKLTQKYNRLCDDMDTIIRQNKAPRNAIAPVKIEMEGLFDLDVDDDIWLDIGLGYNDDDEGDGSAPPLWLSNDDIRAGIRAMLDRDRCLEECKRLLDECSTMQEWFSEEWKVVTMAMQDRVLGRGVKYQLDLRKERLCRLFVTWERTIVGVASTEGLPEWGPSVDEVVGARGIHVLGSGIDVAEDGDYDLEFEHEVDGLLVEHLDSLTILENYRAMQNNVGNVE
ncbi:hypothetical protein BT96DRAFT_960553 [Gymnopus androsaceus JB14]|uniref:Uncharacterized protein n=1 Tax=Gymnopus androsaceus JB14 TaxID=1447944 RepID=A0A6A4GMM9_9AGAR|nr:hypothetical protein BT96DRAFT_960553 [Gymnopus androsaceus JB14]